MPLDGADSFFISRACILHAHRHDGASHDACEDDCDCVVVDFCNVVHQVVSLMDSIQAVFVDETDKFGNLSGYEFLRVVDVAPHDQVSRDHFEENVVGVALLDCIEAVWDGNLVAHVPVVRFQVH